MNETIPKQKEKTPKFQKLKASLSGKGGGKKSRKWIILAAVVVVVIILAIVLLGRGSKRAGSQVDYTQANTEYRAITSSLSGSGTLNPADSYTVVTLIKGEVLTADFEEGDIVDKDTVLYEIDSSDVSNNIEKSEISLSQAQRNYNTMADNAYIKAPVSGTVASLNVAVGDEVTAGQTIATVRDSSVMTLKVPFASDDAQGFYEGQEASVTLDGSFETLYGTVSAVSGADAILTGNMPVRYVTIEVQVSGGLTDAQSASATINGCGSSASDTLKYKAEGIATATAGGTVTAINAAEGSYVSKDQAIVTISGKDLNDQIQSAYDSLRNAQLSMETTQDQLENYSITSPISGTVVDKAYKVGETVESGKTLCVIYDLSYLEMTLNIDELDISKVSVGQPVTITAEAVEGKVYEGVITKVSVAGITANGATFYPVTLRLDETDGLLPGMNVNANIVLSQSDNALAIPNGAVNRGSTVLITKTSPSAVNALETTAPEGYVYVAVTTGISDDNFIEILDGLQEGDVVAYKLSTGKSIYDMMYMGPSENMGGEPGGHGG